MANAIAKMVSEAATVQRAKKVTMASRNEATVSPVTAIPTEQTDLKSARVGVANVNA